MVAGRTVFGPGTDCGGGRVSVPSAARVLAVANGLATATFTSPDGTASRLSGRRYGADATSPPARVARAGMTLAAE
jgi:hypothetical protein